MSKINREPLIRKDREAISDSREIREHLAELQETVGTVSSTPLGVSAKDYGAVGDGVTDDTAAIQAALNASSKVVLGKPGEVYLVTSSLTLPDTIIFDLGGATLKAANTLGYLFIKYSTPRDDFAVTTQTADTNDIVLTSDPGSSLLIGDYVYFTSTTLNGRWPISLRKVASVNTVNITLDRAIPFAYTGTITMKKTSFHGSCIIKNGVIDGTLASSGISNLNDYDYEKWEDIRAFGFNSGGIVNLCASTGARIFSAQDLEFEDCIMSSQAISVWNASTCRICKVTVHADSFGVAASDCDDVSFIDNMISGRAESGGVYSTRGIKVIGCFSYIIDSNTVREQEAGIKIEDSARGVTSDNTLHLCGISINLSHQNGVAGLHLSHIVNGNAIHENQDTGAAIYLAENTRCSIVTNNTLYNCQGDGIRTAGDQFVVDGNCFYEWDLSNGGKRAIVIGTATTLPSTVVGNRAYSATVSNAMLWANASSVQLTIDDNRSNVTDIYETIPLHTGVTDEQTVEIGNGLYFKSLTLTLTTSYVYYEYDDPFPNDTLTAVGTAQAASSSTALVICDVPNSSATHIRAKASEAIDGCLLITGY